MPLLFLLFVGLAAGFGVAFSARNQLSRHSGSAWQATAFLAFAVFVGFVLVPSTLYFYAFHRDWFLLYAINADGAPIKHAIFSVLVMVAFPLSAFLLSASWLRRGAVSWVRNAIVASVGAGALVWLLAWGRLSVVGTRRQFELSYGLSPYFESTAFQGGLLFGAAVCAAVAMLVIRIREREGG